MNVLYTIVFLDSDRPDDMIWLSSPKVGDVIKVNMLVDDELEYYTIVEILDTTVKVRHL